MLKPHADPYGYKKLLAYRKAEELQEECRKITRQFPHSKTMIDLADQMDRSARSTKQNIVEGWKRNTTKEYFDFLGFSVAACAELEEDCDDIWKGRYPELEEIEGVMGAERVERVEKGRMGVKSFEYGYPLNPAQSNQFQSPQFSNPTQSNQPQPPQFSNPAQSVNPLWTLNPEAFNSVQPSQTHDPIQPVQPLNPIRPFQFFDIEKIPFYPLDRTLPPIVQLKLRCKEMNYLSSRIQKSLEVKMKSEKTLPTRYLARENFQKVKKEEDFFEEILTKQGLRRLENGQVVPIEKEGKN